MKRKAKDITAARDPKDMSTMEEVIMTIIEERAPTEVDATADARVDATADVRVDVIPNKTVLHGENSVLKRKREKS